MRSGRRRPAPSRRPLNVIHEDDRWLVVDKPAGIAVHGGAGKTGPSIVERLHAERDARVHLVHRLDRGTAGVLLLARTSESARRASELWERVDKAYWALTSGRPPAPCRIESPLCDPDGRSRDAITDLDHAIAVPDFAPPEVAACALRISTGRLHQIRRHLAGIGHPVVLDDRHGDFALNRAFSERAKALGLPRPKHPFLFCRSLRPPSELGLPTPLEAPWPRSWLPILAAGGLQVDDLGRLA